MGRWISDAEGEEYQNHVDVRRERDMLRMLLRSVSLLVAGAIRQGFVNLTQREALLHAFMKLTGEENAKLAMLIAFLPPRGWGVNVTQSYPPDDPRSPEYEEPIYR